MSLLYISLYMQSSLVMFIPYFLSVAYPEIFFEREVSPGIFFRGGGFNKFSWGQKAERMEICGRWPPSQGFHSICKWVKPVFLLGCYGFIFHGSRNLAQFRNFGGGGFEPPKPPPPRSATTDCRLANSQLKCTTSTNCCMYALLTPDDRQLASPTHVEV
jgi:hypothetical protein